MVGSGPPLLCAGLVIAVVVATLTALSTPAAAARAAIKLVSGAPNPVATQSWQEPSEPDPSRECDPPIGPAALLELDGRSFTYDDTTYEYTIWPFRNATQKERHNSWNAFYGILGLWGYWELEHNQTYLSMMYTDGTLCGDSARSLEVKLQCALPGEQERLGTIEEPETCKYTASLHVHAVCDLDLEVAGEDLESVLAHSANRRLAGTESEESEALEEESEDGGANDAEISPDVTEEGNSDAQSDTSGEGTPSEECVSRDESAAVARLTEQVVSLKRALDEARDQAERHADALKVVLETGSESSIKLGAAAQAADDLVRGLGAGESAEANEAGSGGSDGNTWW